VPQYVYNASKPGAPIFSVLSIKHIPAQNPDNGLRLFIGNVASPSPWPVAPTGQVVAGGPHDLGLYTLGQMQCVCIAVAIYPTPATLNWTPGLVGACQLRATPGGAGNHQHAHSGKPYPGVCCYCGEAQSGRLGDLDQRAVCGRG